MKRAFIFSADSALSLVLLFSAVALLTMHLSEEAHIHRSSLEEFSVMRKADSLMSATISDNNPSDPLLGSAYRSPLKRRIMQNIVDYALLRNAEGRAVADSNLFVSSISLVFSSSGNETIIASTPSGGNCLVLERLVLVADSRQIIQEMKKAKLRMVFCRA
jgi:hypothetical protein